MAIDRSVVAPQREAKVRARPVSTPLVVEPDVVVDLEVMPLAGHDHVLVAIGPSLGGATGLHRDQRGGGGEQRGLGLLAAEPAAHPAHLDGDRGMRAIQHAGDQVLDLAGVLGRRPDMDVAALARNGQRHLALEIEVVLAADGQMALQPVGRSRQRGGRVAARHALAPLDGQVGVAGGAMSMAAGRSA
jgi:hypothetical protein